MSYNDLSSCNCCPTADNLCECTRGGIQYATPCCMEVLNAAETGAAAHCGFETQTLCRIQYGTSDRNEIAIDTNEDGGTFWYEYANKSNPDESCVWFSDATFAWVERLHADEDARDNVANSPPYRFPRLSAIYWMLIAPNPANLIHRYELYLCVANCQKKHCAGGPLADNKQQDRYTRTLARWVPQNSTWDPMFDGSETFNFDRLMAAAEHYPSIINCEWPSGCDSRASSDPSNLPQSLTVRGSCFDTNAACFANCEEVVGGGPANREFGCQECTTDPFDDDCSGDFACTWVWNETSEEWEINIDGCSGSCECVPPMTGCLDNAPVSTPAGTETSDCYIAADHNFGIKPCD